MTCLQFDAAGAATELPVTSAVPLATRRFQLVPVAPEHHRALFALATAHEHQYRWRFRGAVPPFEVFERTLHHHALAQFVIAPCRRPEAVAGHVLAYDASLQDGTCYLGAVLAPGATGALEGVILFIRFLFAHWPFRKLYLRSPVFAVGDYVSAIRNGILHVEGRLRDHIFYGGRTWDELTLALYREHADEWLASHHLHPVSPEAHDPDLEPAS
ncbi:GNAT family N-acetyltransferase [Aciditerrimonas ferrireducens]|uniref:GNAT family N-acetyltransferase n=1 Tax=Aciditerrimonas ferrireducens TaxID=667306 RepID=A0ABV6C4Y9_9ACTN